LAQDDYYYEIQLTNKQLVFYFLAGATVLILCFLAGIMVGRGVDVRGADTRVVREEPVAPIAGESRGARGTPVPVDSYSYPQRLVAEKPPEVLETRIAVPSPVSSATAAQKPTPASTAPARATTPAAAKPTATPKGTPPPKTTPSPKAAATPKPKPTPTPRATATPVAAAAEGPLSLQVGAFKDKASADSVVAQLRRKGYAARAVSPDGARDGLYVVRVGPYKTRAEADRARTRLEQDRFKPFIVRQ
jgi:cell division septation protein DedD